MTMERQVGPLHQSINRAHGSFVHRLKNANLQHSSAPSLWEEETQI